MPVDGYGGAIGSPVHQKPARKESAKGALWEVLFLDA